MIHSTDIARRWAEFLVEMGLAVRRRVRDEISKSIDGLADAVGEEGGDVIYGIDRAAEEAIRDFLASKARRMPPFVLIAEGVDGGCLAVGEGKPEYRVLCDPIDGSRALMYDKRPAWFLAAVGPDLGESTSLLGAVASVMVELPTSKQGWADQFVAVRGRALSAQRDSLVGGGTRQLVIRPSSADSLDGGFAHVADFFPGTKVLAGELMERIATAVTGPVEPGRAKVFNDQYICTGGQQIELMLHDRFCCDLRPLFFQVLEKRGQRVAHGLCCHPYDCAGALVAQQAGVILTDGFGAPLDPPYDTHTAVHWCGYANERLRAKIEPVIQAWLAENGFRREP